MNAEARHRQPLAPEARPEQPPRPPSGDARPPAGGASMAASVLTVQGLDLPRRAPQPPGDELSDVAVERRVTPGWSASTRRSASKGSTRTLASSSATTDAERRPASMSASSPKATPGPIVWRRTRARARRALHLGADAAGDDEEDRVGLVALAEHDLAGGQVDGHGGVERSRSTAPGQAGLEAAARPAGPPASSRSPSSAQEQVVLAPLEGLVGVGAVSMRRRAGARGSWRSGGRRGRGRARPGGRAAATRPRRRR